MKNAKRRTVLTSAATGVGGVAAGLSFSSIGPMAFADTPPTGSDPAPAAKVGANDPRYSHLVSRSANTRFVAKPEYIHLANSTEQVVDAVNEAVAAGKRVTVRSGGHCFDNLVDNDEVIIDISGMNSVYFDSEHHAFVIEPGKTLVEVYRELLLGWGVTIPGGGCNDVGAGGHILGGGYGPLSRLEGLTVDHLYGVEVVTVDADGVAKATVATREEDDPNRDLWWAHTGCGGGNFGIVTRYLMRSPKTDSHDPADLLPRPPSDVLTFAYTWNWEDMDGESFRLLTAQYGQWHEDNSDPDSPGTGIFSVLMLNGRVSEAVMLAGEIAGDDAEALLEEFTTTVTADMAPEPQKHVGWMPWLNQVSNDATEAGDSDRLKLKSGYCKRRMSDDQIAVLWDHLSNNDDPDVLGSVWFVGYGGQVNSVEPADTAVFQRSSVLKAIYIVGWSNPDADSDRVQWIRDLYSEVYAATDGVPEFDDRNAGCFINYADVDLADPEVNGSDTPWHELYYGDNYSRLREIKAAWDPTNVFHHALSIRAAG